jgi:hypothetical protein
VSAAFDFNEAWEFIRDVAKAAIDACRIPALWIPALIFSIAMDIVAALIEWPFRGGANPPTEHKITVMVLMILAKSWFGLTLCRVALAGLRGQVTGILNQWVPVQAALRIGLVTVVLFMPILVGFVMLIVPGVYLLSRWSQTTLVLIDDRARWFEAADESSSLTKGYQSAILIILMSVSTMTLLIEYLVHDIAPLAWAYRAAGMLIGAALAAAMYYELSRRAPWNPEAV